MVRPISLETSRDSTKRRRSVRVLAIASLAITLFGGIQAHSQLAQGAILSGGSIFKGSAAVVERRLCMAIPNSAVAPLYSVKVGKPIVGTGGATCDFVPVGMSVSDDSSSPLFILVGVNDFGSVYGNFTEGDHKLSGVGDKAYWNSQAPGMDAPEVFAEKGKIDCSATTNGELQNTTLPHTISGGNPVVTNAAASKFAAKVGVICSDVFKGK